jgi:hypothetical protein
MLNIRNEDKIKIKKFIREKFSDEPEFDDLCLSLDVRNHFAGNFSSRVNDLIQHLERNAADWENLLLKALLQLKPTFKKEIKDLFGVGNSNNKETGTSLEKDLALKLSKENLRKSIFFCIILRISCFFFASLNGTIAEWASKIKECIFYPHKERKKLMNFLKTMKAVIISCTIFTIMGCAQVPEECDPSLSFLKGSWAGQFDQPGFDLYLIFMVVEDIDVCNFSGRLSLPSYEIITKMEGYLSANNLYWTETEVIEGDESGIILNGTYISDYDSSGILEGNWYYPEDDSYGGSFILYKME